MLPSNSVSEIDLWSGVMFSVNSLASDWSIKFQEAPESIRVGILLEFMKRWVLIMKECLVRELITAGSLVELVFTPRSVSEVSVG